MLYECVSVVFVLEYLESCKVEEEEFIDFDELMCREERRKTFFKSVHLQ